MYLYTARFSRRHCDSERGTGVRKNPNTRVFAVVLSHSRMFEPRRAAGLFEWKGSQPQSALSKMYSASQKSNSVKGYKPKKKLWFNFILTQWNWWKRANPSARHSSLWDGKGRGFDARREKKRSLTPSESRSWSWCSDWARSVKGVEAGPRAKGFNCGAGCTFHSAQCRAGSWRYSGGRTTWRRRRQEPRGRPWPRNPESWRAAHPLYLEGQQRKNRILP